LLAARLDRGGMSQTVVAKNRTTTAARGGCAPRSRSNPVKRHPPELASGRRVAAMPVPGYGVQRTALKPYRPGSYRHTPGHRPGARA
jgi:hypothetical protein